jgi:uncharacterized protein YneF (UPF0154 family)
MGVWYFFFTLSNIIIMLLIMTMNGYVNITLALGLTLGYAITEHITQKHKIKVPPINNVDEHHLPNLLGDVEHERSRLILYKSNVEDHLRSR